MHKIYKKSIRANIIEEIPVHDKTQTGVWINITNPESSDIELVMGQTPLNREEVTTLFDEYERPRIEKNENALIIIFHIPLIHDGVLETTPLVILLTPASIITICKHETQIVSDFIQGFFSFTTTMKSRFVLLLLKRINYYFEKTLKNIDTVIDDLEKNLTRYTDNREINKVFNIKRSLIYYSTAVIANGKVLRKITSGNFLPLFPEDKEILDDLIIDNDQTQEIVSIYSSIITSSMDAYASVVSNNMNVVMKSLTVATITLAVPTTVSSLWGMNVHVPFSDNPYAFFVVLMIALALTTFLNYFYLKRK